MLGRQTQKYVAVAGPQQDFNEVAWVDVADYKLLLKLRFVIKGEMSTDWVVSLSWLDEKNRTQSEEFWMNSPGTTWP